MPVRDSRKRFEVPAEQPSYITFYVFARDRAAIVAQQLIGVGEDWPHRAPRVAPFIDHLFEHAGVGVLRDETGAQHFEAFPGHLFDDGGIVEEPPAAEGHKVGEFAGVDAELVLVLPAQDADEETVLGERNAKALNGAEVGFAYSVAGEFQGRVYQIADADHRRERDVALAANGQDGVFDEERAQAVFGEREGVGQRHGHVDGVHDLGPLGDEPPDFGSGLAGAIGRYVIAFGLQDFPMLRPFVEDAIKAQDGVELRVALGIGFPHRRFVGIERVVRHDGFADAGEAEDVFDVRGEFAGGEELAGFGEDVACSGEPESTEDGDDAAGRFRDRRVFDKEGFPDEVGLSLLAEGEVLVGRDRVGAEEFGFQVVISNQFVDAPEANGAKGGHEEMGMEIDEGDRGKFAVDGGADVHPNITISIGRVLQFRCSERFVKWGKLKLAPGFSPARSGRINDMKNTALLLGLAICLQGADPFFFMQATDPQFGMYSADKDFVQETANWEFAIANVNRLHPAFLVVTGDLTNKAGDAAQIAEYRRINAKLDRSIPLYSVAGNHDVGNDPTPESLAAYRAAYGPDYYAFRSGPIYGIVLDSSLFKAPAKVADEAAKQEKWLAEELAKAQAAGGLIVVFQHIPWFLENAGEADQYFNIPIETRRRALTLFHRYGVRYVFAGHYHRNAFGRDGNLEMITSGPAGMPIGPDPSGLRGAEVKDEAIVSKYYGYGSMPSSIPEKAVQP